jgi:predicted lactoylglutathione lyase
MPQQTPVVPEATAATNTSDATPERLRFGMVVLYVQDLQRSITFYRLLGLDVPDPHPEHPGTACTLADGVTMIITTEALAARLDPAWEQPGRGYPQLLEFFVASDADVDAIWNRLTSAGYRGRTAPAHLIGPYAALIEDPDGHVVMVTSEPASNEERPTTA